MQTRSILRCEAIFDQSEGLRVEDLRRLSTGVLVFSAAAAAGDAVRAGATPQGISLPLLGRSPPSAALASSPFM